MTARWIPLRRARAFVAEHHRHMPSVAGGIIALGAFVDEKLVGVGILGRPIARCTQQCEPFTVEVTRVATDGTRNACSFLYGAIKRVAQTLGFRRIITKTLLDESGASLRGAGWEEYGVSAGGQWDRENRRRSRKVHGGPKRCWQSFLPGIEWE